ncbi:dUTP diphosphatase [Candidatus Aerophobetes bacterium]|nr:dUTP diphosphatase [Candidatus Aerophobetes bacterium]
MQGKRLMALRIKIKQLDPDLPLPVFAHEDDAGCDLFSRTEIVLGPGERKLVPTGITFAIPEGYAGFILPRSGLALNYGIGVVNSPGLIDSGYRGEVAAVLINHDPQKEFRIKKGDKICQLVIQKIEKIQWDVVENLSKTKRGKRGFGSTK